MSKLLTGFVQKMARNQKPWENTRQHKHNTTNDTSTKQPNLTKNRERLKMKKHDDTTQVCLTGGCRDRVTLLLMVATPEGLGGAKK